MNIKKPADSSTAQEQWQMLYKTILHAGANVEFIEPVPNLPDMVFTANSGITYKNKVWVANFSAMQRQNESDLAPTSRTPH